MDEPYELLLKMQDEAEKTKRAANNVAVHLERVSSSGAAHGWPAVDGPGQITVSVIWLSELLDFAHNEGASEF
jgi:hypothetical protein